MNEQMFEAVLELVRNGGRAAIGIVVIHYVIGLIKFVLGMGVIGYAVSKLYKIIRYAIDADANR